MEKKMKALSKMFTWKASRLGIRTDRLHEMYKALILCKVTCGAPALALLTLDPGGTRACVNRINAKLLRALRTVLRTTWRTANLAVLAETGRYSFKHIMWHLELRYWTMFELSHRNKSKYVQYFLLQQRNKCKLDAAVASISKALNASLRSLIGRVMRKPSFLAQAVKDVSNKYDMNRLRT